MIYIRADSNKTIGIGHIMRCLSIADAAKDIGGIVIFITADDSAVPLITGRGYDTIVLDTDYKKMESELDNWPIEEADFVIVDSYYVTSEYLRNLKLRTKKLIFIDDLAAFPYPVDDLVNYNAYGLSLDYHGLYASSNIPEPKLILGPTYAPLRSMFRRVEKKEQPKIVQNVLISTGGSDSEHIALSIAKARLADFTYHLLIGALNSDKDELRALAADQEHIVLHENVTDMRGLIENVDIAVSAAGSTLYEICACGVPLITYIIADNQISGAVAFEKIGLAVNLGDMRNKVDPFMSILAAVDNLSHDYERRVSMGTIMQKMIDGYGSERIVAEIIEKRG